MSVEATFVTVRLPARWAVTPSVDDCSSCESVTIALIEEMAGAVVKLGTLAWQQ